jgi:hypothetical protein
VDFGFLALKNPLERSYGRRRCFHDFNVWRHKKKIEKLTYMHMNPVKRGLVAHPRDWRWSSYAFCQQLPDVMIQIDYVE